MKKYQKPEITVLSFLSKEAISSQSLDTWLTEQFNSDEGIGNAIETYNVSSMM